MVTVAACVCAFVAQTPGPWAFHDTPGPDARLSCNLPPSDLAVPLPGHVGSSPVTEKACAGEGAGSLIGLPWQTIVAQRGHRVQRGRAGHHRGLHADGCRPAPDRQGPGWPPGGGSSPAPSQVSWAVRLCFRLRVPREPRAPGALALLLHAGLRLGAITLLRPLSTGIAAACAPIMAPARSLQL